MAFGNRDTKKGMSVIEIILASGLFVIVATSIVTLLAQSYGSNRLSNEQTIANQYAAEGLEAVRNIRDQSYALLTVSSGTGVAVSSGTWALSGTSTAFDKYTRIISISTVNRDGSGNVSSTGTLDPNTKKVVSTVTWSASPSRVDSVVQTTYLTNWRATLSAATSTPWYNASWLYREQITIDHTKVASSTGTEGYINFPVLMNVTSTNFQATSSGGHVGNSDGSDILFTKSDGTTKVNHEIERYASSTGNLIAWVQMPAVSTSTDTVFYLYYGNSGVANQQNVTSTWDTSYKGVWHLPNGTSLTALDSTSNANNGTVNGSPGSVAGQIDGAANFAASTDRLAITNISLSGVAYTISVWFNIPLPSSCSSFCTLTRGSNDHQVLVNPSNLLGEYDNAGGTAFHSSGFNVTTLSNGWHYLTAEVSGSNTNFYTDGILVGTSNIKSNDNITNIGNYQGGGQPWGKTDEFRVSNIARSADWIRTEYKNQSSPNTFLNVGTEQTP
jgi:Tfp pilus assembly protein PilV